MRNLDAFFVPSTDVPQKRESENKNPVSWEQFQVTLEGFLDTINAFSSNSEVLRDDEVSKQRKKIIDLFDDIEINDDFLKKIIDTYFGEKNQSRWSSLNQNGDQEDFFRGDYFLLFTLMKKVGKLKDKNELSREGVDEIFGIIVKDIDTSYQKKLSGYEEIGGEENYGVVYEDEDYSRELEETDNDYFDSAETEEQFLLNKVIKYLGPRGNEQTIDALLELVKNYGSSVTKHMKDALEGINSSYASREMLLIVRGEEEDTHTKKQMSRLLYLLELGKIGVSENVVNYFDIQYELQNTPPALDFARRITGDGKVGLFDKTGTMLGFIELGDLSNPELKRSVQMLEVTREFLFADPNTPDELRQEFLESYSAFYENAFGEIGGVRLSDLTLREQVWVYKLWKNSDEKTWSGFKGLKEKYGVNGIRTFLSLEFDPSSGKKILSIAENFPEESCQKIFEMYSHLAEVADTIDTKMKEFFVEPPPGIEEYKATSEIMKKAGGLLTDFAGVNEPEDTSELLHKVDAMQKDMVVFSTLFRMAFKGKREVGFHQVRDLSFGGISAADLTADQKKQMVLIAAENYKTEPHVAEELDHLLHDTEALEKNEFILLTRKTEEKDRLLSFLRAEKRGEGKVYIGGFNVDASLRGSGIGEQMLFNTIQALSKEYTVEAVAVPELLAGTHYIEQVGFVAKKFDADVEKTGTFYGWFEIEIDKNAPEYALRTTEKDIQKLYNEQFKGTSPESHIGEPIIIAEFDISKDMKATTSLCERLLNQEGYHLVRYLPLDKEGKKRLYGFEKAPEEVAVEIPLAQAA